MWSDKNIRHFNWVEYLVHHDMKLGWNTITRATNTNHWTCFWPWNKPSAIVMFRLHFQGTTTRKDSVQCPVKQKNTVRNFTLKFIWQKRYSCITKPFCLFQTSWKNKIMSQTQTDWNSALNLSGALIKSQQKSRKIHGWFMGGFD